ncbi:carboxypeptidase-like regulatory domain-containing protein [Dyadobacter sp. CY356]|uniref:carboxypeptidase-like regulatory domain-containing protein n=1 Tax=Dyadobacter sp. CY356 TaxID=2906442 RepID=UPI001F31494A|nr:carboxypeptidase-like regulatory domain-containing protein [Dyadobacter sp. CY356]MCF0055306.1 carboxypeptidase-like regulatory domain-containing protein [Dyadobacter sp. CY356]
MTGKYLITSLLLVLTLQASAQTKKIVGIVTSTENRELLPGIVVWVKGSNQGLVTGSDGYFDLHVTEGDTIEVSSRFFKTKEMIVGSGWNYEVSLETKSRAEVQTGSVRTNFSHREGVYSAVDTKSINVLWKKDRISEQ